MSNETQKADQIAHRLYSKLSLVVNHARATVEPPSTAKIDKWFNLETPDPEISLLKERTRIYRSISTATAVPLFQLQVLLCVPELATNQVLVHLAQDSSRTRIDPTPRYIVLESWTLEYAPNPRDHHQTQDVAPSTMYKHGIPLFRSIFTLLRVLPSWKLARRLRRRGAGNGNFNIRLHVDSGESSIHADEVLNFDTAPPTLRSALKKEQYSLPPITHPMGELAVTVSYLTSPSFQLDTLESVLSSRFLSLEEGPDFTPTLIKNQQRDSISGSPGSLPLRTSLPRSPPRSIADRFVIPPTTSSTNPHARSTSFSSTHGAKGSPAGSPRLGNIPLPVTRNLSGAGMGTSGVSDSSSIRQAAGSMGSREEISALAARVRRESLQGRSTDSPTGVPIRRPPITTVNAFKSSTISSGSPSLHSPSPSLRQHSPLSTGAGPSLPSRPAQSPTSSRVPPSPTGNGYSFPASPITALRPSPSFLPSALGSGRPDSMEGISASPSSLPSGSPRTQGKRYSSSFGQRYAPTSGAASPKGSPGSAPREVDKATSFLSGNTEDDDISAFVQEIDARKPLSSRREGSESRASSPALPPSHTRSSTIREEKDSVRSGEGALRQRTLSAPYSAPVLATESAVEEKLKEMNEMFLASLQGLESRRREREREREPSNPPTDRTATTAAAAPGVKSARRPLDPIAYSGGARRDSPLEGSNVAASGSGSGSGSGSASASGSGIGATAGGVPLPAPYMRPRLGSTGSARSGFSIASEEVIGRMDPELGMGDERRRSRGPLGGGL